MALRVPTVTGPTVAPAPLQGGFQRSSASPELLAGGSRQLGALGNVMQQAGAEIQEREDVDALMRVETEIKGKYLEWEAGAKQRTGQNAWGVTADGRKWWEEETRKARQALKSPRQQRMLDRLVGPLSAQSAGVLSHFEQTQRRQSLVESAQASAVGSINLAAANPTDATVLHNARADILKRTQMLTQLNGWSPEVADAKRTELLTHLHKQVIQSLAQASPATAQAYFEANKGEIEGGQQAEVGAFAMRATATRLGDMAADEVWQTAGPKSDRDPVTLDVMEQQIRKRLAGNDEAVKSGLAGLRERAAAFKDSRRERDDQLEAEVNKAILDGAGSRQVRRMPSFLSLSPESARRIVTFLENREYTAIQRGNASLQREELSAQREQRRLERQGMAQYLELSDPQKLAAMTPTQVLNLLPVLGNEHTKHLMEKRRDLEKPGRLGEAKIDEDDFKRVAQDLGLRPFAAKSEDEKAALGELKFRVEQMIDATQRRAGKAITREEKLTMMRQEMARTVTVDPTWGFAREVPVIMLKPDQVNDVKVPAADRQRIAEEMAVRFQRTNDAQFAPTEENLRRWYLLGKSRAAGLIDAR